MMCSIVGPLNSHLWFMAIFIVDARHHSRKLLLESQSLGGWGRKCKKQKQNVKKRTDTGNTDGKLLPSLSSSRKILSMWIKSDIHQLLLLLWIKSAVISGPLHPPCSLQLLTPYVWLRFPSPFPPWMLACRINHSRTPPNVPVGTLSLYTISQSVTKR